MLVFAITVVYFVVVRGRHKWCGISLRLVYLTILHILYTTKIDHLQCRYRGQVDIVESIFTIKALYCMLILSSSDTKQQGFSTYLDQLKNCCPKLSYESVCQYWPKTEQPPANWQISQNTNLKKTFVQYLCDKTKNLIVSCHDCPAIL